VYLTAVLGSGALLILVVEPLIKSKFKNVIGFIITLLFLFIALGLTGYSIYQGLLPPYLSSSPENGLLANDWLALLFGVAVLSVSLLVALGTSDYLKGDPNRPVFYSLLLFVSSGMVLLSFATDLVMIFLAWELMSIPSYAMTAFAKKDPESNEAGVKYFIISAFASAVILYGLSLMYFLSGGTSLSVVASSITNKSYIPIAALGLLIAGFGIKIAAAPFHMWIPDAYEGAPTVVSALLSAGTKAAGFAVMARIFFISFAALRADWTIVLAIIAAFTMTIGNIAALAQRSMTRMLAYSSIGQAGYILVGFAVATPFSLTGSFLHIINYAVMQSSAFLAVALVKSQTGSASMDTFTGIGRRMYLAPATLAISLLALGGFPPLNGFWSKFVIFGAAIQQPGTIWLGVFAIINSLISIGYYGWVIKRMYVDSPDAASKILEPNGFKIVLVLAVLIILFIGAYPSPFIYFAQQAARTLMV
jgi:proton-translocating NADH-quinone oxidoreductase chain N